MTFLSVNSLASLSPAVRHKSRQNVISGTKDSLEGPDVSLPALRGFRIPAEHVNKTQGQRLYDTINNRAAKAAGTNVAFRGFGLGFLS